MEGEAALIKVVIGNLINITNEEMPLIQGLEKHALKLRWCLESTQEFLNEAETRTISSELIRSCLKKIEDVVFDADNVWDELKYHLLSKKINVPKPLTMAKALKCFSSSYQHGSQQRLIRRIKEINEESEFIIEVLNELGLTWRLVTNAPTLPHASFESGSLSADPIFIGRDADVSELVEKLTNTTVERVLSILAIQGMGGMGKTTLTKKVFNHRQMKDLFESRIWVHVSQTFDPVILFKKILSQIHDRVESTHDILERLQQAFKDKTYLLVLDDVWNEDLLKWEHFIDSILGVTSTKRNAIIITTRNSKVASLVRPLHIHSLNGLSEEDCWSIIKAKAFDKGDDPLAFETIGRNIARNCHGLPLAAKVVGGLLYRAPEEKWTAVQQNWISEYEGQNILRMLKLSFHNLSSSSVKMCFAYCSVFPKDTKIVKQELIELWMAEGFLQPNGRDDMESVGDMFLDELERSYLLQVAERDEYGNVESFVMHNLMHDLASSILGSSNNADGLTQSSVPKQVAKHLRTLFLAGEISDSMLLDLRYLHSLTLTEAKELPSSIRKLIHLRYLNISKSRVRKLPEWIGELHHLQTIRAVTEHFWKLPSTLKYLINLRHLYILSHVKLPAEMGKLTCLQTLRHFAVGDDMGYRIEELESMRNLKGELHISNLEKVHGKAEAKKANIYRKPNLSELVVEWSAVREGETNDENVLEGLQPHPNLKKLGIYGFNGKMFPLWTQKMAVQDGPGGSWVPLNNLIEITLSKCQECEEIPMLEYLPSLKFLYLKGLKKVRFINSSFNNLTSLHLEKLDGLECLPDWLFYNNQNLSYLTIAECPKLRELPDGLNNLNSLEKLAIKYCPNMRSMGNPSGIGGQGILSTLWIQDCGGLMELPRQMVESWMPALRTVSLNNLSRLKNLPMIIDCLATSTLLTELKIECVPELDGCSVKSGCFQSLQKLHLRNLEIEELPQWFGNLLSLQELSISSCKELRRLPSTDALESLRHLDIKDCPMLHIDSMWRNTPLLTIKVDGKRIKSHIDDGVMSSVDNEVLLQDLINTLKQDYSLIRGHDADTKQLQKTLVITQSYLNDAKKSPRDGVKIWLSNLGAEAFDADDVLHVLGYHLLHYKVKKLKTSKDKDKDKVISCFPSLKNIVHRHVAFRIKQINNDFEIMNKRAKDLGLQSISVNAPSGAAPIASFDTDSFTLDPIFIGRDDDVLKLVEILTYSPPEERIFSILAIVGMSGMGKTTLARSVFNQHKIKTQFGSHIWVHVSQIFDPITLFNKILSTLTSHTTDGVESREVTLKKLQEALKDKTYLLVLDDVWNEDIPKWEDFINSISRVTSTKGNGIIITTRSGRVASIVRPLHSHPLTGLSDEDCWSVIKHKSFDQNVKDPSAFEMIGRKIAKRCQGLPLAANVVGGVLCCKSEQEWRVINENCCPDDEGAGNILKILKLSFDHLPSPSLKRCFAYCSNFPKGRRIVKQELIELWMAEGFLQHDERDDMESMDYKYLNVLLLNSLLQIAKKDDYGNVESCEMHDLVHDFASSILPSSYGTNEVRYLIPGDDDSSPIQPETAKHLRTLVFRGTDTTMFSSLQSLRALTLACDRVTEFPSSIYNLKHLRNLNISRTQIVSLPDWICKLPYLQTLNASTKSLRELPSTLRYMISIRHLYIQNHVELPPEIGRLTNLRTLEIFKVCDKKGHKIEELGSLINLRGELSISNLEKVHDNEEAKKAKLSEKQNLLALHLEWGEYGEEEEEEEEEEDKRNDESVLEGLQPHANLKKLSIDGFTGIRFPSWIGELNNLMSITLAEGNRCEEIPKLGHLPNLKSLSLLRLSNVRSINSSFYGIDRCSGGVIFPALESILLSYMPELSLWAEGEFANEVRVFPWLQSLKIHHCYKLECLPSWLFDQAQYLEELEISHCSTLTKLANGLRTLNFLESMTIKCCQNLESIEYPGGGGSSSTLHSLEIRDCKELKSIVGSCAPLPKKVTMADLKRLENLPSFLDCLAESPLLEEFTVVGIPNFKSKIQPFCGLKKLEIDVSREWSEDTSVVISETVDRILQNCPHTLGELNLTGIEIWDDLPESIGNLSLLYSVELENFGVQELPTWFGNLSSLNRLCLSNCAKLRHLPSIKRLTSLQALRFRDCPELRFESERHKIPHRTSIYVNGHRV